MFVAIGNFPLLTSLLSIDELTGKPVIPAIPHTQGMKYYSLYKFINCAFFLFSHSIFFKIFFSFHKYFIPDVPEGQKPGRPINVTVDPVSGGWVIRYAGRVNMTKGIFFYLYIILTSNNFCWELGLH